MLFFHNHIFMARKLFLLLLFSSVLTPGLRAEWVSLNRNKAANTPPNVTVLSSDNLGTTFKVELSGFELSNVNEKGRTYQHIDLMSGTFLSEKGNPALPFIANILAIPEQADLSIEVIETGFVHSFSNVHIAPAVQSQWEGKPASAMVENPETYSSKGIFPENLAAADPPSVFRDFRIARVSVFPVRYLASANEIRVAESVTIRVKYSKGLSVNPKLTPRKKISPSFGKIYRSTILNYEEMLQMQYRGVEEGHDVMLCIMPDNFVTSFQAYATWKRQSGIDIHITKFSDIGANATNPAPIKNHITDAYNNWENPPTYVLLVGDDGKFPKKIATYPDYSFPWDEYFVTVDGSDFMPDIMVGRFTNETDFTLKVMVNKFKQYETAPYVSDPAWFKKGVCCSNNAYASQVYTKRIAANLMLNEGGFTSVDTLMSDGDFWTGTPCTYDLEDVTSAINEGRSYLNYRGEGWSSGWSANCYSFQTTDVTSLSNGQKMPFVTSIGCGVAMFDASEGNCFGEEWVESGTLTSPKGAACFIGPTSNTHTTYNNYIDRGIYVGMFREGLDTPGEAMMRGKLYMYNQFGPYDSYVEYHYKIYCILGDPSIHIWKDLPQLVTCNYPASINVGDNHLQIEVSHLSSGQPVSNAQVCITGAELFATAYTNEQGIAVIDCVPEDEETLTLIVRGGNVIPFQGQIVVTRPTVLVMPQNNPATDDLDGNNDGLLNPGELCSISYVLKNWGSGTASNVQGVLTLLTPELAEVVTTSPVNFGNIAPGSTGSGNPFQFQIKPDCPVGGILRFNLHITSTSASWDYVFETNVNGCELKINQSVVHDFGSDHPDYRLNPGETAAIVLLVENTGLDAAPGVTGILSCSSPHVTITDEFGVFGTLSAQDTATNEINYFKIIVSPDCPIDSIIDFTVAFTTSNGLYPFQTEGTFSIPVSRLTPSDYTGPDEYGYYAYENGDSFYDETPVYDWIEINGIGTALPGVNASEYTRTVNLPFSFRYYGVAYTQIRVSTDGWIAFGSGNQTNPVNIELPNDDNINNMVAVLWDNLFDMDFVNGQIYTYHDQIGKRFIVEWDMVTINSSGDKEGWAKFEVILPDPAFNSTLTNDGEIIIQFQRADLTSSCTVGIENNALYTGIQVVYDDVYNPTASPVAEGRAIKFTTDPPFGTIITSIGDDKITGNGTGDFLEAIQPNPFISSTMINYHLSEQGSVFLAVYSTDGKLIKILKDGMQAAGKHSVVWDGTDNHGIDAGSGLYVIRLNTQHDFTALKVVRTK